MSTVVYKDGIIACDSQMTNGAEMQLGVHKIGRSAHFLFGFTGRMSVMYPLFDWLCDVEGNTFGQDIPDPTTFYRHANKLDTCGSDDGFAIIADREKRVYGVSTDGLVTPYPRGWEAIGSGGTYAVGALHMGADARRAVAVAKECDVSTGGYIHTLWFEEAQEFPDIVRPYAEKP